MSSLNRTSRALRAQSDTKQRPSNSTHPTRNNSFSSRARPIPSHATRSGQSHPNGFAPAPRLVPTSTRARGQNASGSNFPFSGGSPMGPRRTQLAHAAHLRSPVRRGRGRHFRIARRAPRYPLAGPQKDWMIFSVCFSTVVFNRCLFSSIRIFMTCLLYLVSCRTHLSTVNTSPSFFLQSIHLCVAHP